VKSPGEDQAAEYQRRIAQSDLIGDEVQKRHCHSHRDHANKN
jgi:hypothetical protein